MLPSKILSSWYSLDSPQEVLSDEYPFARVSVTFQVFLPHFVMAKLVASSIRVEGYLEGGWVNLGHDLFYMITVRILLPVSPWLRLTAETGPLPRPDHQP